MADYSKAVAAAKQKQDKPCNNTIQKCPFSEESVHTLPKPPQTKQETLQRMEEATRNVEKCRAHNEPLPSSPYSTADKVRIVKEGLMEKFIVRVMKTEYAANSGTIGPPTKGKTTTTYWTTTFTQLEYADKDAELITKAVGIDYDPKTEYTLLLIDQEQAGAAGDMKTFVPTYDNLSEFAQNELVDEFEGREHLVEACMTPEYSQAYEQVHNSAKLDGIDFSDKDMFNEHAESLGFDQDEREILLVRHQMKQELGANEQFLGNGMTKDNTADNPTTPFGNPRDGQDFGPLETFTYDKNPQTLGKLEKAGIVTRIPLKSV